VVSTQSTTRYNVIFFFFFFFFYIFKVFMKFNITKEKTIIIVNKLYII
jgi:hypothetical protein